MTGIRGGMGGGLWCIGNVYTSIVDDLDLTNRNSDRQYCGESP